MTKWRYTTVELRPHATLTLGTDFDRNSLDAVLKEYGQRGWELASTIEVTHHATWKSILIFKQPIEAGEPGSDSPSSETTHDLTSEQFEAWINSD